jgi:hypothetical protein
MLKMLAKYQHRASIVGQPASKIIRHAMPIFRPSIIRSRNLNLPLSRANAFSISTCVAHM